MGQVAWGYVEMGTSLLRARIDSDGSVRTAAGSVIDVDDPTALLWITRRSIDAILGETDVRTSHSSIALVGPNGGQTDAGRAIAAGMTAKGGRNGHVYTTEQLLSVRKAKITIADVIAFYADEAEIAA